MINLKIDKLKEMLSLNKFGKGQNNDIIINLFQSLISEYEKEILSLKQQLKDKDMILNGYKIDYKKLQRQFFQTKKDLDQQCKQTKKFGDELLFFMKKKANIRYEIKLKKYRDEIIKLKKELIYLKNQDTQEAEQKVKILQSKLLRLPINSILRKQIEEYLKENHKNAG